MRSNSFFHTPSTQSMLTAGEQGIVKGAVIELCHHTVEMDAHSTEFNRVRQFFHHGDVWPDQCDYTIYVLAHLQKPIRNLNEFISTAPELAQKISLNRYTFLTKSHSVETNIVEIISRVESYKEICQSVLQAKESEHKKITYDLEKLWKDYCSLKEMLETIIGNTHLTNPQIS